MRASLAPIWRFLMRDEAFRSMALAAAALDDNLNEGGNGAGLDVEMFRAAQDDMQEFAAAARGDETVRARLLASLESEGALADFEEIAHMLPGIDALNTLHDLMPDGSNPLTEEGYYDLRRAFLKAYQFSADSGAYFLLALKGRLTRPWRALGFYYHLASSNDEGLKEAGGTIAVLAESIFQDLEDLARDLERDGAGRFDGDALLVSVPYFADYADGLARQAAKNGDNVFLNRLEACRDVAAGSLERFLEQAVSVLRDASPVRHAGGSSRLTSLRPDYSRPVAAGLIGDAKSAAELLAKSERLAERLGADPSLARSISDDMLESMRVYAEDLITEIRAADGADRQAARKMLEQTLQFCEPLLGADRTGLLRDRAAAASVAV